jgi:hypothetical protein
MAGEFLRETGVLVFVFYGLAALLSAAHEARPALTILGTVTGLFLWISGVLVERRRRE